MPLVKCRVCSKTFYVKPSHQKLGWGKYCSILCRSKSQNNGKYVKCFICGKEIYRSVKELNRSKSGKSFCSKSCQTTWRNQEYIEEKSRKWINGIQVYRRILERSNTKAQCCICHINDKRVLAVHHKDHNRTNNELNNLIWLCLNCHYLVHHDKKIDEAIRGNFYK